MEMAIVAAAVAAAYLPGLDAPSAFDDGRTVLFNPRLRDLPRLQRFACTPTDREPGSETLSDAPYRPVAEATHLVNLRIGGEGIPVQRAGNLLLHICAAWVALWLARRLALEAGWASPAGPLLAVLFFAVHPLGVDAVTYVSQRSVVLEALFAFCCLGAYLASRALPSGGRRRLLQVAGALAAALAAGSKETALTLPLMLGGLAWVLGRPGEGWGGRIRELLPFAAPVLLSPIQILRAGPLGDQGSAVGWLDYWTEEAGAIGRYLALHLVPVHLQFYYDSPVWRPAAPILALGWLGILGMLAWACRGPQALRVPRAGVLLLLLPLALESLLPLRYAAFNYRCYPGLLGGGLLFSWILSRRPWIVGPVLALLFLGTLGRQQVWMDSSRLVREDLRNAPSMARLKTVRAWGLLRSGEVERAERGFRRSIVTGGGDMAFVGRALALDRLGRRPEAIAQLRQLLPLGTPRADAVSDALELAEAAGEAALASDLARLAPRVPTPLASGGARLANLLLDRAALPEAEAVLRKTLRDSPASAGLWDLLGISLARQGKEAEAEAAHRRAISLAPDLPEARLNLAAVLAGRGDLDGAERELEEALRLRPGYPLARVNLERLRAARR